MAVRRSPTKSASLSPWWRSITSRWTGMVSHDAALPRQPVLVGRGRRLDRRCAGPDLLSAHGTTPEEALREVQVAMQAWLEAQREAGRQDPEPRYRPVSAAA